MASRKVSVQYRYVNIDRLREGFHLKNMVVDVLSRAQRGTGASLASLARLRTKDLDQDGSVVLLNKISDASTWSGPFFCGQLLHIKQGGILKGLNGKLDDDVAEYQLENLTLEDSKEVVEGVLYFAIWGNHVGLIEGQRTRGRTLERYLTRLLQDAGEIDPRQLVNLNRQISGHVKEISAFEIKAGRVSPTPDTVEVTDTTQAAREMSSEGSTVIDVLHALRWTEAQIEEFKEKIPAGGWAELFLSVLIKKKRGRKGAIDRATLEEAFRNYPDDALRLTGSGEKEKGGLLRLSDACNVEANGDLLDPTDAMDQIVKALQKWANAGKINATIE